jgi:Acyltransferase
MRILYLILRVFLGYSLKLYYRRTKTVNSPKHFFGRTIYVSNHAGSFMDPLVVAIFQLPIFFFMTRSDVFTKGAKPFLWAAHMLPIYRQHDGQDTKNKNEAVFSKCAKILSNRRNLLLFGEGFTDDTFIRRLKPVKKGAIRIGFSALEKLNWKKNIYLAAIGCNYSDPNHMRSDLLLSNSEKICLNDYKEQYEENSNKVINELTKKLESMMQAQITHVQNKEYAPFHENIMIISRKGMNAVNFNHAIPLKKRWRYSQKLANWMNGKELESDVELNKVKENAESYFSLLSQSNIEERFVFWRKENPKGSRSKELMMLILLFPFAILGAIHCAIPYILVKRYVEKSFGRKVFWGSVKLMVGQPAFVIFNIPFLFLFYFFVYPSIGLSILYFLTIGFTGLAAYMWMVNLNDYRAKGSFLKKNIDEILNEREKLENEINTLIPKELI